MTNTNTIQDLKEKLSGRFGIFLADEFVPWATENPEKFPELYSLIFDTDRKIAWRAAWVCEKISYRHPEWFIDKRSELMQLIMQSRFDGVKRSLFNILLHLPIEEPISVAFLNFCLEHMLSLKEPVAIQAQCMKMAHELCKKEPELLPEFKYILENTEREYYSKGMQTAIRNMIVSLR